MHKAKLDTETLDVMRLFEKTSGAHVKDCIIAERVWFIVAQGQMGMAIGKNGSTIKKIEYLLKRNAIVKEFADDVCVFARHLIEPLAVADITFVDGYLTVACADISTKSKLIGRNRQHISFIENILKRHFPIQGIKVL